MRRVATIAVFILASCLGACVTINIYFPAAAAERAADRIIDEVWQLQPEGSKPNVKPLPDKPAAQ
jgi:hypothetical protein